MRFQALIDKAKAFFVRLRTTPVPLSQVSSRTIAEAWAAACVLSPERALLHFADPIERLAATQLHALGESLRQELEDPAGLKRPELKCGTERRIPAPHMAHTLHGNAIRRGVHRR